MSSLSRTLDNVQHQPNKPTAGEHKNVSNTLETDTRNDVFEFESKDDATWLPSPHANYAPNHSSRPATDYTMVSVVARVTLSLHADEKSATNLSRPTFLSKHTSQENIEWRKN